MITIAGIDEVGRGCLAGPVFAACVVLDQPRLASLPAAERSLIRDSKTLTAQQRDKILPVILRTARDYAVAAATVSEIECVGIQAATLLAMRRALCLLPPPDMLLIDGRAELPGVEIKQRAVVGGDRLHAEIAAASIIAKVARDRWMTTQAVRYPQYRFERHVGYGTRLHRQQLATHGICPLHRRNFAPIKKLLEQHSSDTS